VLTPTLRRATALGLPSSFIFFKEGVWKEMDMQKKRKEKRQM
jgi:hypothetical protein